MISPHRSLAGRAGVVLITALSALFAAPVRADQAAVAPGEVVERSFMNGAGARAYFLYVPTSGSSGRPLMVWLHGCGGPGTMKAGYALAKVAEEQGFVLAYPVQDRAANANECWNWFREAEVHRGSGEASIVADLTTSLITELRVDPGRVYVGGYSAGGAMSSVMGAAYPDVYAAIAPSSGAPYRFDPSGAHAYEEMGPRARPVPAFILQGVADEISVYPVGRTNMLQWLGTDDYADDGALNHSVSRLPQTATVQPPGPGLPLPLVVEDYGADDGCVLGQFLTSPADHMVNGALFYEDVGIGLQRQMMHFLLDHRLGGVHRGCG